MKILLPYDINTTGLRNPFLYQLLRALENSPENHQVRYGFGRLTEYETEWDVIHLHWPEELIKCLIPDAITGNSLEKSHIRLLESILLVWKRKGTRIIATIHNDLPHKKRSDVVKELYSTIYRLANGFIHMGDESERIVSTIFADEVRNKPSTVIPHGDYTIFPNEVDREEARKKLAIEENRPVILTFGAIRSPDELNLGIETTGRAGGADFLYLIAGKLPYPFKSQWRHYYSRRKVYANRGRIRTDERIILPGEVQLYLNAADLIFIPRLRGLNSGNVSLAFTFGKVVAGPDIGVIGEVLKATGNPVFNPVDFASAASAVKKGLELVKRSKGEENLRYSKDVMNWEEIAKKHLQAYTGEDNK